jgi:branched-chain amino acid transport system substrate-binding protein
MTFVPAYAQPVAPNTIKIGALYDITGPIARPKYFGWGFRKGVEAVNKDGGVFVQEFNKKIPLELLEADQAGLEEKAVLGAQYLNEKGIVLLIPTTVFLPPGAGVVEKNHLPTLLTASSMEHAFNKGYRYLFCNFPVNSDFARMVIGLLNSLPKEKRPANIGLFEEQTDFGLEVSQYAQELAPTNGYKIIRVKYTRAQKDLSAAILELKKAGAEAVYGCGTITPDGINMVKQMKELDYNPKALIFLHAPGNHDAWMTLGKDGDYVYMPFQGHWSLKWPGMKEVTVMYEAERKEKPISSVYFTYSSVQVAADAIRRAGSLDREKIRDALAATDMMTITGPLKFKKNGLPIIDYPICAQWINGVETVVWPEQLRERLPIYPAPKWKER